MKEKTKKKIPEHDTQKCDILDCEKCIAECEECK